MTTLKITLPQLGAPLRSLAVCVALTLALALGCGGASETPILANSEEAVMIRVSAILESSEIPAQLDNVGRLSSGSGLPSEWDFPDYDEWKSVLRGMMESRGFAPADSISTLALVDGDADYSSYMVGGLDFADLRLTLRIGKYKKSEYQGFELWERDSNAIAILEDSDLVVRGRRTHVKEVINAFDLGEGFADETDPLKRALDKAGDGLVVRALTHCGRGASNFQYSSSSCEVLAESVTGGDADKTDMFVVYLFSSESLAESALGDIEDSINSRWRDVELKDLKADGEFVTFSATVYE